MEAVESARQQRTDFYLSSMDGSQCGRTVPLVAKVVSVCKKIQVVNVEGERHVVKKWKEEVGGREREKERERE